MNAHNNKLRSGEKKNHQWRGAGREAQERGDICYLELILGFPGGTVLKNSPGNAGDTRDASSIAGSERSPGGGNGEPLQYSCLGILMNRGA